jgi:hypothetical protein
MSLIAPFYKGLVKLDTPDSLALITKRNSATGVEISDEQYLALVRASVRQATELTQDIARAAAGALFAAYQQRGGTPSCLVTVEGCPQSVGGQSMTGASIMESIWHHVVPPEVMSALPAPIVEHVSDCTVREARAVLAHVGPGETVHGITHEYHAKRVGKILREEANIHHVVGDVFTPEQVIERMADTQPSSRFIADLVQAGAPSDETVKAERKKEAFIYGPLHKVSRMGEKITFGAFNLELFLAKKMRK